MSHLFDRTCQRRIHAGKRRALAACAVWWLVPACLVPGCAAFEGVSLPQVAWRRSTQLEKRVDAPRVADVPSTPDQLHLPPLESGRGGVAPVSHVIAPPHQVTLPSEYVLAGAGGATSPIGVVGDGCLPSGLASSWNGPSPVAAGQAEYAQERRRVEELERHVEKLETRLANAEAELQSTRHTMQDLGLSLQNARQELSELTHEVRYWRREIQQSQAAMANQHAHDIARLDELAQLLTELAERNGVSHGSVKERGP